MSVGLTLHFLTQNLRHPLIFQSSFTRCVIDAFGFDLSANVGTREGFQVYEDRDTFYTALQAFTQDGENIRFLSNIFYDGDGKIEAGFFVLTKKLLGRRVVGGHAGKNCSDRSRQRLWRNNWSRRRSTKSPHIQLIRASSSSLLQRQVVGYVGV